MDDERTADTRGIGGSFYAKEKFKLLEKNENIGRDATGSSRHKNQIIL